MIVHFLLYKLVNITIPSNITYNGFDTFSNCTSLTNVYYDGSIKDWCNIKFYNQSSTPMFNAKKFYINANNEYVLLSNIIIPEDT